MQITLPHVKYKLDLPTMFYNILYQVTNNQIILDTAYSYSEAEKEAAIANSIQQTTNISVLSNSKLCN